MHNKYRRKIFSILNLFLVIIFFACAPTPVVIQKPAHLPYSQIISKVPQIHQGRHECGPASMAMVLNYWGVKKNIEELKDDLRWHPEEGVSYQNMLRFPYKTYGFKVDFEKEGSIEQLMEQISKNRPVIIRQWLNYDAKYKCDMGHWRVVIGYDHEKGKIYLKDPAITMGGHSELKYKEFIDLWDLSKHPNPSKNFMLILIPLEKKGE